MGKPMNAKKREIARSLNYVFENENGKCVKAFEEYFRTIQLDKMLKIKIDDPNFHINCAYTRGVCDGIENMITYRDALIKEYKKEKQKQKE